jgi:hypothetical protein
MVEIGSWNWRVERQSGWSQERRVTMYIARILCCKTRQQTRPDEIALLPGLVLVVDRGTKVVFTPKGSLLREHLHTLETEPL